MFPAKFEDHFAAVEVISAAALEHSLYDLYELAHGSLRSRGTSPIVTKDHVAECNAYVVHNKTNPNPAGNCTA